MVRIAEHLEDALQIVMLEEAWAQSGRVCGYRKLGDDLRDLGEARLVRTVLRAWQG